MFKKLFLFIFLISLSTQSQSIISGELIPENESFTWVALYQLKGSKQIFVKSSMVENGKFSIEVPNNKPNGMYRLRYKTDNQSFIDIIYSNENIHLSFNPENPIKTVNYLSSEENQLFGTYTKESTILKEKLSNIQLSFFRLKAESDKENYAFLYVKILKDFHIIQQEFEERSANKLANHFIRASNKFFSEALIEDPQEYLNSEKQHYFDFIDFKDNELLNSTFISESVLSYVFYLNVSEDVVVQNVLYKNSINEVMSIVGDNSDLKSEIITTLLNSFAEVENINLIDFLLKNYYEKLPEALKNVADIQSILAKVKLAVGKTAPDFTWEENGNTKSLHVLNNVDTYILVFWSTSCSHCLIEIPKLYEFINDFKNVHVVAVSLETNSIEFDKYKEQFKNWSNVLGLQKWENRIARDYEIVSTPTYFILDANKKIISKPEELDDVKAFFNH